MMVIIIAIALFLLAMLLIWKGSDWITDSLVPVAAKMGTSYIAVTTLLFASLLSLPEIFSSLYSYFMGFLEVGLGIIIGSVIMNIGIIGLAAIIKPANVNVSIVLRDGIYMVAMAIIVLLLGTDLHYGAADGGILFLLFVPYALNVWMSEKNKPEKKKKKSIERIKKELSLFGNIPLLNNLNFLRLKASGLTFALGGFMLLVGSYLFSYSLVTFQENLSLSGLVVGFVIGAIGTGAPNIAGAIQGTIKGESDVAVTETFGSNIFTLLITLGLLAVLKPFDIEGKIFYFDLTWMIIMHLLLIALMFKSYKYKESSITRYDGAALLIFYLVIVAVNLAVYRG